MPTLVIGTWIATALTALSAALMPFVLRGPLRAVFIVSASVAVALWHARVYPETRSPFEQVAFACALLSLAWLVLAETVSLLRREGNHREERGYVTDLARSASLAFGVVATVLLSVQLGMRAAYTLVDVINNFPGHGAEQFRFSIHGAWSLGMLLTAAGIALVRRRDPRLITCAFTIGAMLLAWCWLTGPVYTHTKAGGYERTGLTLGLQLSWAAWMLVIVTLVPLLEKHKATPEPARPDQPSIEIRPAHPGMQLASGALAVTLALLIAYHLIVPLRWETGGFFFPTLLTALSCGLGACACLRWLGWGWSRLNAEAGLGLIALGVCAIIVAIVPVTGNSLQAAYPVIFNAIMVGLCITTLLYVWRAETWYERAKIEAMSATVSRLIPHLRRFSFLAASLAFFVGIVMMIWPRLPMVAVMDDSLHRVCAGVGANLLLLLAVLWSGRRMRQPAFHILTVLAVFSLAGFLLVRMLPFSSRVSG